MKLKGLLLLLFFVFFFTNGNEVAGAIEINEDSQEYSLYSEIEVLEDPENIWTIQEVISPPLSNQFKQNEGGIPNFGYTSSNYWVRFELYNNSTIEDWLLEIPYPPHDSITLYEVNDREDLVGRETGDLLHFEKRGINHRNFIYELTIPPGDSVEYYLRFDSEGSMQLPLTLWREESFSQKSINEYLLLGLYYGIAVVMIFYNLFLLCSLRMRSYLWYILFILTVALTHLTLNGLAYQYVWPESPWWNNRAILFFMAAANALGLIFTKDFLNTRLYTPKLHRFIKVSVFLHMTLIIILFIRYDLALNLVIGATILHVFTVIIAAGLCWKKGFRPARYFFIGWVVFLATVFISSLADAGMLPLNFFTKYASQMGSALEVVLFSLALGDKINTLRREKEEAERKVKASQEAALEQLKRTDKMKDEFLANTSHELRTPLTGIIGIAESLYDGATGDLKESFKRNLSLIIHSGKRLSHLVNDLLDVSKLKHKEIDLVTKPVSMKDVTDLVLDISKPLAKKKHLKLINDIPKDLPSVRADENRVQQILHNLIGNALKFTDEGTIRVRAEQRDESVVITISDTGIGLSEEDADTIFNEFEQGKNHGQGGAGLGLTITRNLVDLHGGNIEIESELGIGTSISFSLPLYVGEILEKDLPILSPTYEAAPEIIDANMLPESSLPSTGKILIADDEPVNIQVLRNHLTLSGYEVVVAHDGEEVMQMIDSHSPIDVVILDVMMPKRSGYEVSRLLRERFSFTELPILMITARSQIEDIVAAFQAGANDYLTKPVYKEELTARVETLLTLHQTVKAVMEQSKEITRANEELAHLNEELEKRVEERTKALKNRTEELLRTENSRRRVLSNISHDLGTPMTSLQGYVKAMIDGMIRSNDQKYLAIIYEKILFIDRLIQDLYDLSHLEARQVSFRWERVSVQHFITGFLRNFEEDVINENFTFQFQDHFVEGKEDEEVRVDIDRMKQVMTNLIYNAVKYTNEGGTITIQAMDAASFYKMARFTPSMTEVASTATDLNIGKNDERRLIIGVHDVGEGMDAETLSKIFERMFRAESSRPNRGGSTGLGLAICKEIIEYHHGVIWAESIQKIGSSFYFALPIFPAEPES